VLALGELRNRLVATRDEKPFYAKDFSSHDAIVPPQGPRTPPRRWFFRSAGAKWIQSERRRSAAPGISVPGLVDRRSLDW
jgi:hypothetical protein